MISTKTEQNIGVLEMAKLKAEHLRAQADKLPEAQAKQLYRQADRIWGGTVLNVLSGVQEVYHGEARE